METQSRGVEISKLFREIMLLLKQNMAKIYENSGITAPQGMIIGYISKFGKMKISDLSTRLGFSNSTVSGIIDRLEKQKMVERERSADDKRVVYVKITSKFEEVHQDFYKKTEENIENIIKRGTSEEIIKVVEGLTTLKKLLGNNLEEETKK